MNELNNTNFSNLTTVTSYNFKNSELNLLAAEIDATKNAVEATADQGAKNLARLFATCEAKKLYEADGFKNTADFAQQVFDYSKSATSKLIRVWNKYLANPIAIGCNGATSDQFTVGQLQELLTAEQAKLTTLDIDPHTSAKAIRALVAKPKAIESKADGVVDNTDTPNEPKSENSRNAYFTAMLDALSHIAEYCDDEGIIADADALRSKLMVYGTK